MRLHGPHINKYASTIAQAIVVVVVVVRVVLFGADVSAVHARDATQWTFSARVCCVVLRAFLRRMRVRR